MRGDVTGQLRVFVALWPVIATLSAQGVISVPSLESVEEPVRRQIEMAIDNARSTESAEAYGQLARVLHAYEFLDEAAGAYEHARRLAPRDYRWPHLLGALREQSGRFEEAVDLYLAALRLEPDDHAAQIRLGQVFLQLDRRGEARTQFEAQRSRFPASAAAGLGEIALRERRFTDAIRLFEDALRRAPHASALNYSIGMAYRGLGRAREAEARLKQAGPGRVRAADPLADGLPALLRGYRAPLNQARVELHAGSLSAAAAMFRRAIDAAPDDMDEAAVVELAIRLADAQLFADAIALVNAAHARFPARDATATTLARLLAASPDASLRNGARALEIAMQVFARSATPAHAETVALALSELRRCDEAARWMQTAIAAAEREGDGAEVARLRASATPCR